MSAAARPGGSFTTRRPVAISMVFIAALVFGLFSLRLLPVTLMPELSYPTLTVRTEYPGAAPEEVENDVSRPVEEALGVVSGLRRISSVSRAGVSDVILEFTWDTKMTDAVQDSLEKLDLILLPEQAESPLILRFDPSLDPVMELSLSGSGDRFSGEEGLRRVRRLADLRVKRDLEKIPGVAAARVRGGLEEEIHVLIDEQRLQRSGISIERVIERLRQENINLAGGTITEGRTEYMVRTLNEYQDLQQIADTVVARYDDRDVRVRDLGEVRRGHREREIVTRTDENESVQIDIFKEADANIVALAGRVKAALGRFDIEAAQKREAEAAKRADADEGEKGKKEGERRGGRGGRGRGGPRMAGGGGLVQQLYQEEGLEVRLVADRSLFIQNSIKEVRNTAVFGGLLAVLVLLFFLKDLRTTAIIALSIPISLIVTFAPLNLFGVSLNIMSLGGLALGVGMLVDSSIVVLESIFRCREEGDDVESSAVRGTAEVRGAVIASTLTTIAVFFPMVFVEGVAGQAFGDLGMAVVVSLLAALVVALTLIPMLASRQGIRWGKPSAEYRWLRFNSIRVFVRDFKNYFTKPRGTLGTILKWLLSPLVVIYIVVRMIISIILEIIAKLLLGVVFLVALLGRWISWLVGRMGAWLGGNAGSAIDRGMEATRAFYQRRLGASLESPGRVMTVAIAALLLTGVLATRLDTELLPEVRQGEFTVEVTLPVGTPLEQTDAAVAPVERAILAEKEHIKSLLLTVGYDAANSNRSDEGEHTARFKVLLEDASDPRVEDQVLDRLRQRFARIPDLEAQVVRPVLFSFKAPIEVEVHGDDLLALRRQSEAVSVEMASLSELTDVEVSLRRGAPEVQVVYDRDLLARYDLNPEQVARLVRDQVQGFEATRFNLKDRRIPIVVRLALTDRETVEDVESLIVNPGGDRPIPLTAVADVELAEGPSEVRRIDGRRVAVVTANINSGYSMGSAVESIRSRLNGMDWPAGSTFLIAGQNEEWERSRSSLFLALALSIFLVYVIMAGQFESLLHPLVILFAIPFAFFGTVLALWLLNISLSIVVFLGMIMLAGIVVNNAIVLVDYINQLRARGRSVVEAIVEAGTVRLRPILMTTATTCLGLLPMALGAGDGAELRTPMAIAVISGLLVSTLLTLIVIPVVYLLVDRLRQRITQRQTAKDPDEIDEAMAEPA